MIIVLPVMVICPYCNHENEDKASFLITEKRVTKAHYKNIFCESCFQKITFKGKLTAESQSKKYVYRKGE